MVAALCRLGIFVVTMNHLWTLYCDTNVLYITFDIVVEKLKLAVFWFTVYSYTCRNLSFVSLQRVPMYVTGWHSLSVWQLNTLTFNGESPLAQLKLEERPVRQWFSNMYYARYVYCSLQNSNFSGNRIHSERRNRPTSVWCGLGKLDWDVDR